jgi:hypothetical protein
MKKHEDQDDRQDSRSLYLKLAYPDTMEALQEIPQ